MSEDTEPAVTPAPAAPAPVVEPTPPQASVPAVGAPAKAPVKAPRHRIERLATKKKLDSSTYIAARSLASWGRNEYVTEADFNAVVHRLLVAPPAAGGLLPVEAWCARLNTPSWYFTMAKHFHRWAVGQELTQADYETAMQDALSVRIGN